MVSRSAAKCGVDQSQLIARDVEEALFYLYDQSCHNEGYLKHLKRIAANLRNNRTLVQRLMSGELTGTQLVRLTPEELQTEELHKMVCWRCDVMCKHWHTASQSVLDRDFRIFDCVYGKIEFGTVFVLFLFTNSKRSC